MMLLNVDTSPGSSMGSHRIGSYSVLARYASPLGRRIGWTFGDGLQTLPIRRKQYLNRGYSLNQRAVGSPRRPHIGPPIAREPPVRTIRGGIQTPALGHSAPTLTVPPPPLQVRVQDAQRNQSSVE